MSLEELHSLFYRHLEDNEELPEEVNDGENILITLIIYGSIYLVALLLCCTLRRHFPKVYQVRHVNPKYQCSLAKEQYGWISWMYQLAIINEDDIMEQCGLDGLCFLRTMTFGCKVAVVGILNSVWLFPIYATAPESEETLGETGLASLSATSVPPSNGRLIATAVAAWIYFGFTMKLIHSELEWFTRKRHLHLAKTTPRNYSIYVDGISFEYRTSAALLKYFQNAFGKDTVLEAHVAMDIPNLDKLVGRRTKLLWQLEHAVNVKNVKGVTPTHKVDGVMVNSIEAYTEELRELNQQISDDIVLIMAKQDPEVIRKQEEMKQLLADGIATSVAGVSRISEAESQSHSLVSSIADESAYGKYQAEQETSKMFLNGGEEPLSQDPPPQDLTIQEEDEEEEDDALVSVDLDEKVEKKSGFARMSTKMSNVTDKGASGLKTMTDKAVSMVKSEEDGNTRQSGFVTFKNLTTTHAAIQMVHHHKPFVMKVSEAPMPHDIFWFMVGKTHDKQQSGKLISLGITGFLCLFWTIPVAFFSSLTEVDSLRENVKFIDDMLNEFPWLEQFFAQIAPLLIVGLNAVLPHILRIIAMFELPISNSILEASVMVKLSIFMIIQTFFVSAISGSLFQAVDSFVNDPWAAIDVLANSLPKQAIYFVQILLIATFLGQAVELLNIPRTVVAKIRSWFGPGLTEKERNTPWMGLITLVEPWPVMYAFIMGKAILFYMVIYVYSAMTPITNYFLALCFILLNIGWRHQLIYVYPVLKDSGGKLFTGFIHLNITCMIIAQFVLVAWLGIKKAPVAAGLMVPVIIVTFIFNAYIKQQHYRVADHLPTSECVETDYKNNPLDYSFVKDQYLQPSLRATDEVPENCQDIFYRDAASDIMVSNGDEENQKLLDGDMS